MNIKLSGRESINFEVDPETLKDEFLKQVVIEYNIEHKLLLSSSRNNSISKNHFILRYNLEEDQEGFEVLALQPLAIDDRVIGR